MSASTASPAPTAAPLQIPLWVDSHGVGGRMRSLSIDLAASPSKRAPRAYGARLVPYTFASRLPFLTPRTPLPCRPGGQEELSVLLLSSGRLCVKQASDGAGRGLFAAVPFAPGDVVLTEAAFVASPGPWSFEVVCHSCLRAEPEDGPELARCSGGCCWAHYCGAACAERGAGVHTDAECAAMRDAGFASLCLPAAVVLAGRLLREQRGASTRDVAEADDDAGAAAGGEEEDCDPLPAAQSRLCADLCGWSDALPEGEKARFAGWEELVEALAGDAPASVRRQRDDGGGGGEASSVDAGGGGASSAPFSLSRAPLSLSPSLPAWCAPEGARGGGAGAGALAALHRNAFRVFDARSPSPVCVAAALFPCAARANHSCDPNAVAATTQPGLGWGLTLTATRSIQPGEEVRISYVAGVGGDAAGPAAGEPEAEAAVLREQYLFSCACGAPSCVAAARAPAEEAGGAG